MSHHHQYVVMDGVLELHDHMPILPIMCNKACQPVERPMLTSWAKRKTGATSLSHLEHTLRALNGKHVKITIEWEEEKEDAPCA